MTEERLQAIEAALREIRGKYVLGYYKFPGWQPVVISPEELLELAEGYRAGRRLGVGEGPWAGRGPGTGIQGE